MRPVVGVDPGAKTTGIVLRHGNDLLGHWTVTNPLYPALPQDYLHTVIAVVAGAHAGETVGPVVPGFRDPLIAVEAVEPPNPHMGMISVVAILHTATVLGALRGRFDCVLVDPGKNGSLALQFYPPELVGPRERGPYSNGKARHTRSAWDVAGKAHLFEGMPR
jgi:hypothetical protein